MFDGHKVFRKWIEVFRDWIRYFYIIFFCGFEFVGYFTVLYVVCVCDIVTENRYFIEGSISKFEIWRFHVRLHSMHLCAIALVNYRFAFCERHFKIYVRTKLNIWWFNAALFKIFFKENFLLIAHFFIYFKFKYLLFLSDWYSLLIRHIFSKAHVLLSIYKKLIWFLWKNMFFRILCLRA